MGIMWPPRLTACMTLAYPEPMHTPLTIFDDPADYASRFVSGDHMSVAEAHVFFADQHHGQTDKQDRDYYLHHLVPIAESVEHLGDAAVIAALGHDWIEDIIKDVTRATTILCAMRAPGSAISAIVSVTRIPGETYTSLITRSCADPLGVEIKLADNKRNITSNPALALIDLTLAESLLTNRYLPARDRLIEARTRHRAGLN